MSSKPNGGTAELSGLANGGAAELNGLANGGAYRLYLLVPRTIVVTVGALGRRRFEPGTYVYIGSASRGLRQRVARHVRLATEKQGRRHWHIDALLLHRATRLLRTEALPGEVECRLSHALFSSGTVAVPLAGFGATDCSHGCPAHLYRLLQPEIG